LRLFSDDLNAIAFKSSARGEEESGQCTWQHRCLPHPGCVWWLASLSDTARL